jgi:hypothetical protein
LVALGVLHGTHDAPQSDPNKVPRENASISWAAVGIASTRAGAASAGGSKEASAPHIVVEDAGEAAQRGSRAVDSRRCSSSPVLDVRIWAHRYASAR